MSIHKYTLDKTIVNEVQTLKIPHNAWVLSADIQGDTICVWAEANALRDSERREFLIALTGSLDDIERWKFLKTIQHDGLVYHIFNRNEGQR